MVNHEDVNPYDVGSVRRYTQNRRLDSARRMYIDREIEKLKFEYGQEHINPYDLGQVARIHSIFRKSRDIYRRNRRYYI